MAKLEKYKQKFEDLAAQLRAASSSPDNIVYDGFVWSLKPELKSNIIDLCTSIEAEIEENIASSLKQFETYKDLSLIEHVTFLGLARDTVHLTALKTMCCDDDLSSLESFGNGSVQNLIFATDLMICERDGKSKWRVINGEDVH